MPGALHGRPASDPLSPPDTPQRAHARAVQVLRLVIRLYETVQSPDWVDICQCLMFLDDAPEVARILNRLLQGGEVRRRAGWGMKR